MFQSHLSRRVSGDEKMSDPLEYADYFTFLLAYSDVMDIYDLRWLWLRYMLNCKKLIASFDDIIKQSKRLPPSLFNTVKVIW